MCFVGPRVNPSSDVTVVGHFSIDTLNLPSRPKPYVVMGGAVAYVSLVAKRLDAAASVISKVGGDFPEAYMWWLGEEGVDVSGVVRLSSEQTTRFELTYNGDLSSRTLKLKSKAPAIALSDIPSSLCAKTIHVAPIAREVSFEVVEHLKRCCEILSIDPQGMLRNFDADGNVTCCSPADMLLLALINIYKSSLDEICTITGQLDLNSAIKAVHDVGPETVIVTNGAKGSVVSVQGTRYNIPACHSEKVVDPTGAGDVFIGAFLTEYIRQKDPLWCACVGSAAASLVIEGVGPTFLGAKEEIYQRASALYEKEVNQ
jgi:sugar/nucleoside kinase (ribokinase family)